jgi:CRISPR-associated protein Cst2
MLQYVYGAVVTAEGCAANNRGKNAGNNTTLQKAVYHGQEHSTISAESVRFALRYWLQQQGVPVNRKFDKDTNKFVFQDEKYVTWGKGDGVFADDDLFGFMNAEAPKAEGEGDPAIDPAGAAVAVVEENAAPAPAEDKKARGKKEKIKGKASKRASPLSLSRGVSLRPWVGESSFNCVGGVKEKGKLSLYGSEMHTTAYQFSFALDTGGVVDKKNIGYLMDAITDPTPVAGNHSRFFYEFAPESVVYRVTTAHAGRIQNAFEYDETDRRPSLTKLVDEVECGDIPAAEIIVGGQVAKTPEGERLRELGCYVVRSVFEASRDVKRRIAENGGDFEVVGDGVSERPAGTSVSHKAPDNGRLTAVGV